MKTKIKSLGFAGSFALPFRSSAALLAALCIPASVARAVSEAAADANGEIKTHTLFMGADFSVQHGSQYYQVKDVTGGAFIITVNGANVAVPMGLKAVNLRVQSSLKITEIGATIGDLKGERSYTPETDPVRLFTKATVDSAFQYSDSQMESNDAAQKVDVANAQMGKANTGASAPVSGHGNPLANSLSSQVLTTDQAELTQASVGQVAPEENMGTPLGGDRFDAMEVEFKVSSGKPLNNPFIVIVTRFRERNAPPKVVRNQIYAQSLNPVGAKPTRIHVLAGGFPPGFELLEYQVHLYNGGLEVATNVSSKRVPLTRDEAFEYMKLNYIGSHKGATLPASPAMGHLPGDLPSRIGSGEFSRTYYVKVSKDGLPGGAFLDDGCTRKADSPYLESVIENIRFNPALENGTPVNGVAALKLSELAGAGDGSA
jgi:hypothetical protein